MKALTFNIHLLEPLLINDISGGDPNSAVGIEFIPGSAIRGALIGKYLQGRAKNSVDAEDIEFRELFFNGAVSFLDAYPLTKDNKRALPTPLSWHVEKGADESIIYDFANEYYPDSEKNELDINWKTVSEPFCHLFENDDGEGMIKLYQPSDQVKIHIFRADRQNVSTEESTIFRYQSLEAGQNYSGVILAENVHCFEKIKELLAEESNFSFGKSHPGYGHVSIYSKNSSDDWEEYFSVGDAEDDKVIITLLSDTIVRDENTGSYITNINSALGVKSGSLKNAYVKIRLRGGFNRTWNLPLPQILAIRAGSVFVYERDSELLDRLGILKTTGIGEKREEGYGRIAINWHQINKTKAEKEDLYGLSISSPKLKNTNSLNLAQTIVNRMANEKSDQALLNAVTRLKIDSIPKKSQLSRMRVVARRALSDENKLAVITDHITKMKKTARDQFQNSWIEGKSLEQWIITLAENPQIVWIILQINENILPSLGETKPKLEDRAVEYTVRLIDAVLHKASKEANNE